MDKEKALRRFKNFSGFSNSEIAEIAQVCQEASFNQGDVVLVEGETAKKLFLVLKGKISLEKKVQLGRSKSTRRATVSIVGPNRVAGWSSVIAPYIYTSTGVCLEPTHVLVLEGKAVREFISAHPASGLVFMDAIAATISSRLQNVNTTLTYFLSIISHELKSPLAAIENYLQVMLGGFTGELNNKQQRMLERSFLRVNDLRGLINDILDLARMRPEQIQADFEWLDPSESGTQAIEDVQLMASQKGIKIMVSAPAEFKPLVAAKRRLRQLFSNLLSNAVKFSPQEGVITLRAWDEPDQFVFEIFDQGPGIPADEQPFIFEDFFRGRGTQDIAGSGLGLSIVKKIVDAHKGEIRLESPYQAGKSGTKFIVSIPRDLATPEMKQSQWAAQEKTSS